MGNICKMHKNLTAVHENYVQKCDVFDVLLSDGGDCQSKASENPMRIDETIHKKWNK